MNPRATELTIPAINRDMYNVMTSFAKIIKIQEINCGNAKISKQIFRPMMTDKNGKIRLPTIIPISKIEATHDPSNSVKGISEFLLFKNGSAAEVQFTVDPFIVVKMEACNEKVIKTIFTQFFYQLRK